LSRAGNPTRLGGIYDGQETGLADSLAIELDNELSEIERFEGEFQAFAARHGLAARTVGQIWLAFDELLTNTVSYGFPAGGHHKISVRLDMDGERFTAELVDDGVAFDPLAAAEPDLDAALEEREIGGLGIHFVRVVMDSLDYRREKDQNRLVMTKRIRPDGQQD
jgi:anti-sigma regulatory factor (Ser/Thr protein kinase)